MYKKSLLRPIFIIGLITIFFASCDKDFNELGTDIVGDDHYGFEKYADATVKAYNQKIGPIASNNLPINPLGFYSNPAFGDTQANFVTQLELSTINPVFNNTDPDLYVQLPVIDSVVMDIPYFKTLKTENTNGTKDYELDSIYGAAVGSANSKFKLFVYKSNYYLRDLDPGQSLAEQQLFYTDQNSLIDNNKDVLLNNAPQTDPAPDTEGTHNADGRENENFYFDKKEHKLTTYETDGVTKKYTRYAPSMRLHLRTDVFYDKILNAPAGQLDNNALFKNYFRGIYFKTENGNPGNMALINFKAGKITIYYKEDKITPDNVTTTTANEYKREVVSKTFALNLSGNTVSLLQNSNENIDYLNAANSSQEASRIYLKGGEGAMSVIDLFGPDLVKYDLHVDGNNKPIDENGVLVPVDAYGKPTTGHYFVYTITNTPNGIADEVEQLRYPEIDNTVGQIYHSAKNRWMINEANLTFYVDKLAMSNFLPATPEAQPVEPNRIFLYDLTNKKVLIDYTFDFTSNSTHPKFSKFIHDGIVQTEDVGDGRGERAKKYRVRITNYVRNLIKNDSTNVRLGLSVTENINSIGLSKLKTPNSNFSSAPTMSVLSQLGTVLYGTSPVVPDDKKLKLEIYYTKPD